MAAKTKRYDKLNKLNLDEIRAKAAIGATQPLPPPWQPKSMREDGAKPERRKEG